MFSMKPSSLRRGSVGLDRKILANPAQNAPVAFKKILEFVK